MANDQKTGRKFDNIDLAGGNRVYAAGDGAGNSGSGDRRDGGSMIRKKRALVFRRIEHLDLGWRTPQPVIPNFEKKTGSKVKTTLFSQNEEHYA